MGGARWKACNEYNMDLLMGEQSASWMLGLCAICKLAIMVEAWAK